MPLSCSTSSLSGSDGLIQFQPAGTTFCLLDYADFPAGTSITVPSSADFKVGDPIVFSEEGSATLDSALTADATVYVVAVAPGKIDVSATKGGTPITLLNDGGTGTGNTAGAVNHINVKYAEFESLCSVKEFSLDLSRESIDTTTLPCSVGTASKYASFRTQVSGFASGEGTLSVLFSADQASLANRLMANAMLKNATANVKLYVNAVAGAGSTIDDAASSYFEGEISLQGFSLTVNPDDATTAEISYSLSAAPKAVFGVSLD